MAKNPGFDEVVAVFNELGWAGADLSDAPTLPLGTPQQRKTVLGGLKSVKWTAEGVVVGDSSRRHDAGEIDGGGRVLGGREAVMLTLFAVRMGVGDARRVATMLRFVGGEQAHDALTALLAERGPEFAQSFVAQVVTGWWSEGNRGSWFPAQVVQLVARHQLDVPELTGYLQDWSYMALPHLIADQTLLSAARRSRSAAALGEGQVPEAVVRDRFAEHVRAGIAAGVPASGMFGQVVSAGIAKGWLHRDEAVELVFAALDRATGPADRRVWLRVWLDGLTVTPDEVVARAEALLPLLGVDHQALARLAPVLVAGVDESLLPDVVAVGLAATTKKAVLSVLTTLTARARPSDGTVAAIGPQVTVLDTTKAPELARAQRVLVDAWGLGRPEVPKPMTGQNLWKPTPPVWTVPRFDHGPETAEALTQATVDVVGRGNVVDVTVERFLTLANAVARRAPDVARAVLRGMPEPTPAGRWARGEPQQTHSYDNPTTDRERQVFAALGEYPCLLSEPSTVDFAITPADLVARLRVYSAAGASAAEADLCLALTRVDSSMVDDAVLAALDGLPVPVVPFPVVSYCTGDSHPSEPLTAGPVAARYLADPVVEPRIVTDPTFGAMAAPLVVPGPLDDLPPRLVANNHRHVSGFPAPVSSVFPGWTADVGVLEVRAHTEARLPQYQPSSALGLVLRQVVRRATPLPPGAAVNLLAIGRSLPPGAEEHTAAAVTEAWLRGLLRPGVPDVRLLDWAERPQALAATASTLADLAGQGMLAVVWPVLDDLLVVANAPRMLAGTLEVVQVLGDLLGEVRHAVARGLADPSVLDLPGLRAVASRPGSSQAVKTARAFVAQLPD